MRKKGNQSVSREAKPCLPRHRGSVSPFIARPSDVPGLCIPLLVHTILFNPSSLPKRDRPFLGWPLEPYLPGPQLFSTQYWPHCGPVPPHVLLHSEFLSKLQIRLYFWWILGRDGSAPLCITLSVLKFLGVFSFLKQRGNFWQKPWKDF